jgi:PII-like signaling protein
MKGYIVTFFTQESRGLENGMPTAHWIVEKAKELGIRGATLSSSQEGFGHDGRYHSGSIFDLEDRPLQVVLVLTPDEFDLLLAIIKDKQVSVFYTKTPTEFGNTLDP